MLKFCKLLREGVKKNNYFFSSLLLLRGEGGVGGDVKELLGFFIIMFLLECSSMVLEPQNML